MALETATYLSDLEPSNPAPTDQLRQADDHLRLIKQVLKNTFPNLTGPVTLDQDQLNAPVTIPVGTITMWYGSAASVPLGWTLCNGTAVDLIDGSGTITPPDLRGRVPMGADASNAPGTTLGSLTASITTSEAGSHTHTVDGGSHTHSATVEATTLTLDQIPSHRHGNGVTDNISGAYNHGSFTASPAGTISINNDSAPGTVEGYTTNEGGSQPHTHGLTLGASTHSHAVSTAAAHSHTADFSVVQPSLALHFIMKI